jgi:capsular exopolysaccharide synthesis family protein
MALQPVPGVSHLSLLASGPIPPNPSELLASTRFRDVVELLKREHDVVLIDTPPLLPVTDAAVIVPCCDKVLLIVSAGRSTRKQVRTASDLLRQVDANMAGAVLNGVDSNRRDGYYSYYYAEDEGTRQPRSGSTNGYASNGAGVPRNGQSQAPARQSPRRRS